MIFLKGEQTKAIKQSIATLKQLDKMLAVLVSSKVEQVGNVKNCYDSLRLGDVTKVLEQIDIENINVDKDGIRVAALKKAGITNIAKLSRYSKMQLKGIGGIGDAMANKIVNNAELIKRNALKKIFVPLTADKSNHNMQKIIESLDYLIFYKDILDAAEKLYIENHDVLYDAIQATAVKTSNMKWLFASGKNKEKASLAEEQLYTMLRSGLGTDTMSLVDKYNAVSYSQAKAFDNFTANSAPFYAMLEVVLGSDYVSGEGQINNLLPAELLQSIEDYKLDLSLLKANLRRYQEFGTKYILHQKKVLLGDEMGLGKTMQAIASFCHLKAQGKKHFLVICPLSVVVNWQREIVDNSQLETIEVYGEGRDEEMLQWAEEGGVAVTTFETLNKVPVPDNINIDMVVVDEAHYIKNPEAQRTKSVLGACKLSERILFMSGTPLENKVEEMQFLISCLQPEISKMTRNMKQLAHAEKFRQAIAPVYLRRVREDVLKELPELIEKMQWCLMGDEEGKKYKESLLSKNFMMVRQVSWNVDNEKILESSKAKRLLEICDEAKESGRKILIFSYFRDTLNKVSTLLGDRTVGIIDGSIDSGVRQSMIDKLKDAPSGSVLVCQIQAGGVGLNIQAASVVIFCEPQIKPSLEMQAIARAYRMGQANSVIVHRLLIKNSVDERVMTMLNHKNKLFDNFADESVIGDMDAKINESEVMNSIVDEEIKRLGLDKIG